MYVVPAQLLRSLYNALSEYFASDTAEASLGQGVTAAVRLLESRERGATAKLHARLARLGEVVTALAPYDVGVNLSEVSAKIDPTRTLTDIAELEIAMRESLKLLEAKVNAIVGAPVTTPAARLEIARILGAWEVAERRAVTDLGDADAAAVDTSLTQAKFEAYLQDRFSEPGMTVTSFRPLSGGFGKQTILATVSGSALDGPIVIRRDPDVATVDNDCHRVVKEFPVIRAAFDRGFPAPDAIWVDTEHKLLPGPDFLVMRMSPGKTGGNVFGSKEALSSELLNVLGSGAARLHTLPPLHELGEVTDSIRAELWDQTLEQTTRSYIEGWRDLFLANVHNPSPTLMALYGWLLDNVPAPEGRPVLVHGDIGFHNMLIDEGRLSALVDWEFAHIGDPAEDLGSVRNVIGDVEWAETLACYRAAGGPEIDAKRLHFFRVWQHVRNASASNLSMGKFQTGEIPDLKLAYTGHYHFPLFIGAAWALIEAGPEGHMGLVEY